MFTHSGVHIKYYANMQCNIKLSPLCSVSHIVFKKLPTSFRVLTQWTNCHMHGNWEPWQMFPDLWGKSEYRYVLSPIHHTRKRFFFLHSYFNRQNLTQRFMCTFWHFEPNTECFVRAARFLEHLRSAATQGWGPAVHTIKKEMFANCKINVLFL